MTPIRDTAERFFDACETGKGWDGCRQYCHSGATFSAQAGALAGVNTLEGYTNWMKGLFTPVPDGRYELRSFAVDEGRNSAMAYAVFKERTRVMAGRWLQLGGMWRPTTCTSCSSTEIGSAT
jgi:hypothetical protein